ncbi:MAG TPA: NAD-dependent dihydropyrimidine dehydrogenase subunit PreA [Rhodanobacteraceae bacterium]|nr:NAD-dependent dihydropyrimidine dehydrogenase subunit PreA [Rhodanobacteraceae bacterium]
MVDLSCNIAGIRSPNPFWLASAPPTDKEVNVVRAFAAGWGGVVWKTLGDDPPVVNVNGPRYGAWWSGDRRVMGFNNIELISDRAFDTNIAEITRVKAAWPDRAMVVSVMFPLDETVWKTRLAQIEASGADGIEINLGCPHGMSERGMGSAMGQQPDLIEQVTRLAKAHTRLPVIVKLTPNVTNILPAALAAKRGGADAVSLINTINSIMSVDLDQMAPEPTIDGKGSHGGYCGQAVKPIALHMVGEIGRHGDTRGLPVSAIGGITNWRDAAEFMALGACGVQVCTAAMVYGFKIVDDLIEGLAEWMESKGYARLDDFIGLAVPKLTDWKNLNLNYVTKAHIDQDLCIQCGRCYIACEDTSHQAISASRNGERHFEVKDDECVGCNLCVEVCPVENCLTMVQLEQGSDPRTGRAISHEHADWTTHPNNVLAST